MAVVVGTLTIDLKASTASFSQSMDKMSHLSARTATDIKRSLERISAIGLAMGAAIATGTAAVIMRSLNAADALNDLAQATGSTTETLSKLKAGMNNLSTSELGAMLANLNKAQFEAMTGNKELAKAFDALGIKTDDGKGHLRDSGIVMTEIAVKMASMADSGNKAALAKQTMGKAAESAIPYLNQFGENQAKVNEETERFGLVLSTATGALSGEAKDNIDRFHGLLDGIGNTLLGATLPAINQLIVRLLDLTKQADIPALAKTFGAGITKAVIATGDALEFAVKHARELKIALEALAAIKLTTIAIPLIAQLSAGGVGNVGKALNTMTLGFLGLDKVVPVLAKVWGQLAVGTASMMALATSEGIASAGAFVLRGALAAVGGPVGIAIAAIVGLSIALYKFRDSTFSIKGTTYQLRDWWGASWIVMGNVLTWIGDKFGKLVAFLKTAWTSFTKLISNDVILQGLTKTFSAIADLMRKVSGNLVPQFTIDALNEAKRQREAAAAKEKSDAAAATNADNKPGGGGRGGNPPPDLRGLAKREKDPYLEEIEKLKLAIETQKAFLAVVGDTPDAIAAVTAAEKAEAIILDLNTKLKNADRKELTLGQKEELRYRVALEASTTALVAYSTGLVSQFDAASLASEQARVMAAAILEGDDAVRAATISNTLLAASYRKTNAELAKFNELKGALESALATQAINELNAATNKTVVSLQDELAARKLINAAIGQGATAERQAALAARLLPLNQQIAKASPDNKKALENQRDAVKALTEAEWAEADKRNLDGMQEELATRKLILNAIGLSTQAQREAALQAKLYSLNQAIDKTPNDQNLLKQRDAITALEHAQWAQVDAQDALALRSPADQHRATTVEIERLRGAMKPATSEWDQYMQSLILATKAQDAFNTETDETISLLLRSGKAKDGVTAFFLDMQKQAKDTGRIIYEALHSAFDKVAANLTELITGGKADFGAMLKDIGKQMINASIKQALAKGIGAIGKALGIKMPGVPDGTKENPWYVKLSDGLEDKGGKGPLGAIFDGLKNKLKKILGLGGDEDKGPTGDDKGPGGVLADEAVGVAGDALGVDFKNFFGTTAKRDGQTEATAYWVKVTEKKTGKEAITGALMGLLGGGGEGGGGGEAAGAATSTISYMAKGGFVSPDKAYIVGESGPEILRGASGRISSNAQSKRMLGGSASSHHYVIDARGTDPVLTEQRTKAAIIAAHNSAIGTGFQVGQEHLKRTPQTARR